MLSCKSHHPQTSVVNLIDREQGVETSKTDSLTVRASILSDESYHAEDQADLDSDPDPGKKEKEKEKAKKPRRAPKSNFFSILNGSSSFPLRFLFVFPFISFALLCFSLFAPREEARLRVRQGDRPGSQPDGRELRLVGRGDERHSRHGGGE